MGRWCPNNNSSVQDPKNTSLLMLFMTMVVVIVVVETVMVMVEVMVKMVMPVMVISMISRKPVREGLLFSLPYRPGNRGSKC